MSHEMHDGLGSDARALLDAAREGLSPDAAAIGRVRAKVDSSLAATGGAIATKLGLLAMVVAVATGALIYGAHDREVAPARLTAIEPGFTRESILPAPATVRESLPPTTRTTRTVIAMPPDVVSTSAPVADPAVHGGPHPAHPARTAYSPHQARTIDLGREVALIDQAMAAMRAGDPAKALAAVQVHAAETGGAGQLAEDAAAIEVEALCRLHDESVAAKLAAFDARWADSAQRSRLSTSCH